MSPLDGQRRQAPCVLIFEDDREFRRVLVELLEDEGFEVSTCDSYAVLCEAMRAREKHIVLADFWGTSHTELSPRERDEIRELGRAVPTILMTGRSWAAGMEPHELNLVSILPKPPALDDIIAQIVDCARAISE